MLLLMMTRKKYAIDVALEGGEIFVLSIYQRKCMTLTTDILYCTEYIYDFVY